MSSGYGFRGGGGGGISLVVPVTPMVKKIMMVNALVYAATVLLKTFLPTATWDTFWGTVALDHREVFGSWELWTLFSYGWLHDLGPIPLVSVVVCCAAAYGMVLAYRSQWAKREFFLFIFAFIAGMMLLGALGFGAPLHLVGNLIGLYFFGHMFEERWGPQRFLLFWTLCIITGGVVSTLVWYKFPGLTGVGIVGASAGTMGLIAAFAVYFPEQQVLYGLVVPIKGKYFLLIAVVFDLISLVGGTRVAVFAHFGGVLAALLLTTGYWRPGKIKGYVDKKLKRPKKRHLTVVPPPDDEDPPRYLH